MAKNGTALKVEVVSEGPPVRSLADILKNPPKLELANAPKAKVTESRAVRQKRAS